MAVVSDRKYRNISKRHFTKTSQFSEKRHDYIPFGKPNFSEEEIEAVSNTLRKGWVGMGNETLSFEQELSEYVEAGALVSVNSCTSALFLSLLISDVKEEDEVICPSLTWCSTANSALYLGAKPVFADINEETLCLDTESILSKVTEKTKAVILVHYGGYATDVYSLKKKLPSNIVLIEDAAHALGSRYYNGKMVGSSGNLTCFSFYANKNLSTGEGGAIALYDKFQIQRLKSLRQHGMHTSAWNRFVKPKSILYSIIDHLGYKMNYTDLQASIGRVQLKRQAEFQKIRSEIASYYFKELSSLNFNLKFQENILSDKHAKHLFPVILPLYKMNISRDEFIMKLRSYNIGASIHYAPLHLMPLYNHPKSDELPVTEKIASSVLTLPISASITMDDARYIVDKFKKVFISNLV